MSDADDDIIKEARERWEAAASEDQENRREAAIDLRFRAGDQWPAEFRAAREREKRPCLTVNRLGQYVRKITGDIRLNPPGIKVRPVDGGADGDLAETYTGLIRNIEANSDASGVYAMAADAQVSCGIGWMRVNSRYCSDTVWEQDLEISLIPNPFAVVMDPAAVCPVRSDANWCFVTDMIPIADFKAQYPDANLTSWDAVDTAWGDWREGERIRVAEYWRKVPVKRRLALLQNGSTVDLTGMEKDEIAQVVAQGGQILRERIANGHRVEMWLLNGVEVLDDVTNWAGKYLPIVPVMGEEVFVGDRVVRMGLIRQMRDSQMLYNVQRTALAEASAMAPKAKWLVTADQIAGYEGHWAVANTSNLAYLPYVSVANQQPPQRIAPDMPSAGLLQELQTAAMDMEATSGIYRENLGRETNAVSGRAILSRQREGDTGTYVYADNLARSVAHVGRLLVDLIPKIYDRERQVRILGEDGQEKFVPINAEIMDPATGQMRKINDLSAGSFDVVPSTGPSFSTRQEEGREAYIALMQANPELAAIGVDIFARMQQWPGSDEFAKRARKLAVAKGLAEPEQGDPPPQPQPPDPNMLLAQAEMQKAQMDSQAAMAKLQADYQIRMAEIALDRDRLALDTAKASADVRHDAAELQLAAEKESARNHMQGERDMLDGMIKAGKFTREMAQPPAPPMHYGQP